MPNKPRYHIHLPAFLPTGPAHPITGEPTPELHAPGELAFEGEPNPSLWVCLNGEAVAAMRAAITKRIERERDVLSMLDPSKASAAQHRGRIARWEAQLRDLKVGTPPPEPPKPAGTVEASTMSGLQVPSMRPSDSPWRR